MASLVQIEAIDAAMAEAVRRSRDWIACRPGCAECCNGPFAISDTDAERLRDALARTDPARRAAILERAAAWLAMVTTTDEDGLPEGMDDIPCPVLDPGTGTCELYDARPVTCRCFGPATRMPDGSIAACELCYSGATNDDIASCAVTLCLPEEHGNATVASVLARTGV